ncbi:hypothetical protein E1B28_005875 [Marasmius oreades]|uniref:Uncharacterized protein n=1 Tax=Marasmius oreades TaxID=181124 RepID=A0A9P7UUP8_9AGAR|nr:uncharacterized protein E1B28_005875 [Marasmius oreades]KAG7095087.1 hypothetical protein E1B28_005875 [Marasmius oreades]
MRKRMTSCYRVDTGTLKMFKSLFEIMDTNRWRRFEMGMATPSSIWFVETDTMVSCMDIEIKIANIETYSRCLLLDLLDLLLPKILPSLLSAQNHAGSTALHWAALNSHLTTIQKLVLFPDGPGIDLIDIKNNAGHSSFAEAELSGWEEGAKWLVQMMKLDENLKEDDKDSEADDSNGADDIEVEIQDADGQVAKMTISGGGKK